MARRPAAAVCALVLAGAWCLSGCVDRTPPPLWPTPPPPPLAEPIGDPVQVDVAAPPRPEPDDDAADDEASAPQPGGLGPWQPEPR